MSRLPEVIGLYNVEQKYRRLRNQLQFGILFLVGVFILGTCWYTFVEGWSWEDGAYMTMITLSTVGFGEIHPLGDRSRMFTMGLILTGVINVGYIVNRFTEAIIGGYFQERMKMKQQEQMIAGLDEHYILCGLGRTGKQVAKEFQEENIPFVLIDSNPEQIEMAQDLGYACIQGDATLDQFLLQARIDKAVCLIAALPSDAENLYTVISAKALNPEIRALARASNEEAVKKLQRAGADTVVSPYITGGHRLAAAAIRPQVMDFVDGILTGSERSYYLEEFRLERDRCPYMGQTLSEARLRLQSGALVLAIRREDGTLVPGPTGETFLLEGDSLICMGTSEQLIDLNRILNPSPREHPRPPKP